MLLKSCWIVVRQFVENLNSLLMQDVEIKSLDFECKVIFPPEDEILEIHNRIRNEFHKFIEHLHDGIDSNILNDFNESDSIFQEMRYLDP